MWDMLDELKVRANSMDVPDNLTYFKQIIFFYVKIIEIQNNNHKQMHQRMLRYLSDILFEYEALEVKQYLLYIGEWQCNMKNSINKDGLDYSYAIIDMKNISCEELIQSDNPSAVVLSILCDFENKDKQMVVKATPRE